MKVITVVSDVHELGFNQFLKPSCINHGLELITLEIPAFNPASKDLRLKDQSLYRYLQTVDENEIILFTDGYDTAFLAGEQEILNKFKKFNTNILFSAEINCWPYTTLSLSYPSIDTHFKYLNSGAFIGFAGFIKHLIATNQPLPSKGKPTGLTSLDPDVLFIWSNQYYWHRIYLANTNAIQLDLTGEIFYTLGTNIEKMRAVYKPDIGYDCASLMSEETTRIEEELQLKAHRIESRITGTRPCHLHFNGPVPKALMKSNFLGLQLFPFINQ